MCKVKFYEFVCEMDLKRHLTIEEWKFSIAVSEGDCVSTSASLNELIEPRHIDTIYTEKIDDMNAKSDEMKVKICSKFNILKLTPVNIFSHIVLHHVNKFSQ